MKRWWVCCLFACGGERATVKEEVGARPAVPASLRDPHEAHLGEMRQITFGGENAEAYWNSAGTELIFQSTPDGGLCDQIFRVSADGRGTPTRVSTGKGRTTCSYFYPGQKEILYASTHETSKECPPKPSFARGYVWPIYDSYEIYRANADGSGARKITNAPGYDAEATIAPDGLIVFTSLRDGDMEIYSMKGDGSDVRRLTHRQGPDGGPFFSWDGKRVAFRGRELGAGTELDDYRALGGHMDHVRSLEDALRRGAWHNEGAPTARAWAALPAANPWPLARPPLLG